MCHREWVRCESSVGQYGGPGWSPGWRCHRESGVGQDGSPEVRSVTKMFFVFCIGLLEKDCGVSQRSGSGSVGQDEVQDECRQIVFLFFVLVCLIVEQE